MDRNNPQPPWPNLAWFKRETRYYLAGAGVAGLAFFLSVALLAALNWLEKALR